MFANTQKGLINHFRKNINLYFFLLLTFIVGVFIGAFTVNGLSAIQTGELKNYLKGFLALLENHPIDNNELFKIATIENLKLVLALWVLGVTIIGIPFIFIILGVRGFITGFTVGIIIKIMGMRGVLFSTGTILLKDLIIIPCLIALGVNGINFSLNIIKKKSIKKIYKESLKVEFISYCMFTAVLSCILILGILIEVYIAPVFIRMISEIIKM